MERLTELNSPQRFDVVTQTGVPLELWERILVWMSPQDYMQHGRLVCWQFNELRKTDVLGLLGQALIRAAVCGDPALTNNLLNAGATVNIRDELGRTPLIATFVGEQSEERFAVIQLLVAWGANVGAGDNQQRTPYLLACDELWKAAQDLLKDRGATWMQWKSWVSKPLDQAVSRGELERIKQLATEGADVNLCMALNGMTPLMFTAREGAVEVMAVLLEVGADVHAGDLHGNTALSVAAKAGQAAAIELLLEHEASPDTCDAARCTPLMFAIESNCVEGVIALRQAGARVDLLDYTGRSALDRVPAEARELRKAVEAPLGKLAKPRKKRDACIVS